MDLNSTPTEVAEATLQGYYMKTGYPEVSYILRNHSLHQFMTLFATHIQASPFPESYKSCLHL